MRRFFSAHTWPLSIMLLWLIMEWLRARLLTGFPWLSIGYSQTESPLNSLYPLIGEIGVSALIVMVCMSMAIGYKNKQYYLASLPLLIVFFVSASVKDINWTVPTGVEKSVALVQGNIAQSLRWDPEQDEITKQKYLELTEPLWDKDIIVWPEAAVPSLEIMSSDYLIALDDKATQTNTGFITGIVNYNPRTDIVYNSLLSLGVDTNKNNFPYYYNHEKRFSKHHLLPIGEFVPFESLLRPLAPIFDLPMSSFTRGDFIQPNLVANNTSFIPAICFEIAFPKQVRANIFEHSDAIITVSNDAWFGDSHGPHQHLQIAVVRAKEFGLPVLRATNNGVTAIIDHRGNIQAVAEQFKDTALLGMLKKVSGRTPYFTFSDIPIYCIAITLFVIGLFFNRNKTAQKPTE